MAIRIPVYEQQVRPGAIPGVRERADDQVPRAQEQLGASIGNLGGAVARGIDEITRAVDEQQTRAALHQAQVKMSRAQRELLDGEQGITRLQGQQAMEGKSRAVEGFEAAAKRVKQEMGSDRHRRAFEPILEQDRQQFLATVDRHVASESENFARSAFKALLEETENDALAHAAAGRVDDMREALVVGLAHIEGEGRRRGLPAEQIAIQSRAFTETAHIKILDGMINAGDLAGATAHLAVYREQIGAQALASAKIDERLAAGERRGRARRVAEEIFGKFGRDIGTALANIADRDLPDDVNADARRLYLEAVRDADAAEDRKDDGLLAAIELDAREDGPFPLTTDERYPLLSNRGKIVADKIMRGLVAERSPDRSEQRYRMNQNRLKAKAIAERLALDDPDQIDPVRLGADGGSRSIEEIRTFKARELKARKRNGGATSARVNDKIRAAVAGLEPAIAAETTAAIKRRYHDWDDNPTDENGKPTTAKDPLVPDKLLDQWIAEATAKRVFIEAAGKRKGKTVLGTAGAAEVLRVPAIDPSTGKVVAPKTGILVKMKASNGQTYQVPAEKVQEKIDKFGWKVAP